MDKRCDIRCRFATTTEDRCVCRCGGEGHGQGWVELKKNKEIYENPDNKGQAYIDAEMERR